MAFYIKIQKAFEDDAIARYVFESDQSRKGLFELNKKTGEISLIEPMPNDEQSNCFNRAATKIMREWREGRLPEMTEWAS